MKIVYFNKLGMILFLKPHNVDIKTVTTRIFLEVFLKHFYINILYHHYYELMHRLLNFTRLNNKKFLKCSVKKSQFNVYRVKIVA